MLSSMLMLSRGASFCPSMLGECLSPFCAQTQRMIVRWPRRTIRSCSPLRLPNQPKPSHALTQVSSLGARATGDAADDATRCICICVALRRIAARSTGQRRRPCLRAGARRPCAPHSSRERERHTHTAVKAPVANAAVPPRRRVSARIGRTALRLVSPSRFSPPATEPPRLLSDQRRLNFPTPARTTPRRCAGTSHLAARMLAESQFLMVPLSSVHWAHLVHGIDCPLNRKKTRRIHTIRSERKGE